MKEDRSFEIEFVRNTSYQLTCVCIVWDANDRNIKNCKSISEYDGKSKKEKRII